MSEAAEARAHVTGADLVAGFRTLGVKSGDTIFVHASLRRFGRIEGDMETVIGSLLEAVGPEGTLAMPGFTFQLLDVPNPVFDVRNTPVWASKLYEAFRTRPGTLRSHHATHSVCAAGARARELTAEHSASPCGAESPFHKFAEWGATILLMGVSHNSSTTLHAVEEQEKLFYVGGQKLVGATLIDEEGRSQPMVSCRHEMSRQYDFNRLDAALVREGIERQTAIGDAIVRAVEAGRMFELAVAAVRADPTALLRLGEETVKIPVSVRGEMA